jgi:hypothetical protein
MAYGFHSLYLVNRVSCVKVDSPLNRTKSENDVNVKKQFSQLFESSSEVLNLSGKKTTKLSLTPVRKKTNHNYVLIPT